MATAKILLPDPIARVFSPPRGAVRYRGLKGGRGSGKSMGAAKMAATWGLVEPLRILGTRELQVSIKESFYTEVVSAIESEPWLKAHYQIGNSFIRGRNGTEFIFRGLRHNISSIKSMARIDLCIVEEAEDVPESSFRDLFPTIRADRSEIWLLWNPRTEGSPVDARFVQHVPANAIIETCNYADNPWFPGVLEQERQNDRLRLTPEHYAHIWEGAYLKNTKATVLAGKVRVAELTDADLKHADGPYHGADWGFAEDPTVVVRCHVLPRPNGRFSLYVDQESYGRKVPVTALATLFRRIPAIGGYTVRADNARPELVHHVNGDRGPDGKLRPLTVVSAKKWPGSVEDGVNWLQSCDEIIIHPRCGHTIEEARLWSCKVDRLTGDPLPELVDAHNHCWDAVRYALQPLISRYQEGTEPSVRDL